MAVGGEPQIGGGGTGTETAASGSRGGRRKWVVAGVLVIALALVAVSLYAFVLAPGGQTGGSETVSDVLLVYDPGGENYKGTRGGTSAEAYLVEDYRGTPRTRAVLIDSTTPISSTGAVNLVRSTDGAWTVSSFTPKAATASTQASLASNPFSLEYANVDVDLNAVGVVYENHTFALGLGDTQDFVILSTERIPLFFTNVHVRGVVVRPAFLTSLNLFLFDALQDLDRFKAEADIPALTDAPAVLLAESITYQSAVVVEGDVHDVILPEEVAQLGLSLLGADTASEGSQFLLNLTRNVDEVLVTLGEKTNRLASLDHWFVLGTRNLTYGEMQGIVRLNVAESDFTKLQARLGISFPAPTDLPITFHVGVTTDEDPVASSYAAKEVRDLWSLLQGAHADPPVAAVETNAFALVLDYNNVAAYLGTALSLPSSAMEKLRAVGEFRNPAMALLFDRNLLDGLQTPSETLWEYGAVAFLRDFPSTQDLFYYLNLKGEVYDSWMFLGVSPTGLASIPVLVADASADATEGIYAGHLWDIDANVTTGTAVVVDTEGYAIGTTVKTILNYTQARGIVKYLPVDIGFYSLHDKLPGAFPPEFYHVPLVYPTWATGTTYLGAHVDMRALFVRGQPQRDLLASFLGQFLGEGQGGPSAAFGDLLGNIIKDLPGLSMLDGYLLAFSVRDAPIASDLFLTSLTAEDLVSDGGAVDADLTAVVSRTGSWLDFDAIVVRFVVTSPSGRIFAGDTPSIVLGLLDTPVSPLLPLTIDQPEAGVYRVKAHLMKLEAYGTEIDSLSATFTLYVLVLEYVSGDGQSGPRGSTLSAPFVVRVVNGTGVPVQGFQVSWSITWEPYPLNPGSLSATTTITDAAGLAKSTLTLGTGLIPGGVYTITATLGLDPSFSQYFAATAT